MRTVRQIDTEAVWDVPDIDDNRQDPDPMKVKIRPLTARDKARIEHKVMVDAVRNSQEITEQHDSIMRMLVADAILEVTGYIAIDKDGKRKEIKTGNELVDAVMAGPPTEARLLDDIYFALIDLSRLNDGVAKNSSGLPGSSSPQTTSPGPPTDGGVVIAEPVAA